MALTIQVDPLTVDICKGRFPLNILLLLQSETPKSSMLDLSH